MSRMLTRLGHEVHTAENGAVASEMLRASHQRIEGAPVFDIVMLDK
jgi:CheY-like chemotaxis protein